MKAYAGRTLNEAIASGEEPEYFTLLDPEVAANVARLRADAATAKLARKRITDRITTREELIFKLRGRRHTQAQIAAAVGISRTRVGEILARGPQTPAEFYWLPL